MDAVSAMRSNDVEPITKDAQLNPGEKQPCGCGCGVMGVLKKAPMRDGLRHAKAVCKCPRCRGSKNRNYGKDAQRKAVKALAIKQARFRGQMGNEENLRDDHFRFEMKAGKQVSNTGTMFLAAEAQSAANKAESDVRGFVASFTPPGWTEPLVVMRGSTYRTYVKPALDEFWGCSSDA